MHECLIGIKLAMNKTCVLGSFGEKAVYGINIGIGRIMEIL